MDAGAVPDPDTIIWWMQQSEEARSAICAKNSAMATQLHSLISGIYSW
jgi:hypothetical protein